MPSISLSRQLAVGALCLCLIAPLASATTPPGPLSGHWRFDDDGTVIELTACGEALCGIVRQPPGNSAKPAQAAHCGTVLLGDMKPDGNTGQHRGWAVDPADQKRYDATLEPDGKGLKLVVRALGGMYSESFRLRPAAEVPSTCKP
jgi:uncharacterized protein (DUF2147 family)